MMPLSGNSRVNRRGSGSNDRATCTGRLWLVISFEMLAHESRESQFLFRSEYRPSTLTSGLVDQATRTAAAEIPVARARRRLMLRTARRRHLPGDHITEHLKRSPTKILSKNR
jgi:hypothetical protein